MSIAEKYNYILEDIEKCALSCGRNPADITLIAVSKGMSSECVRQAYCEGCRDFGENRLQEAVEKITLCPKDIRWHMIGSLQRNKARRVIGQFCLIHSVDTPELAMKISQCSSELGIVSSILLQVNTSGELSKHGMSPEHWRTAFDGIIASPFLKVEGLMTMAPYTQDEKRIRDSFSRLRLFRDELIVKTGKRNILSHLSMGMSNDYRIAISEGATLLRIGTAIFGNNFNFRSR